MKQEMQTGGRAAAIKISRDVAPAMTNELSLAVGWTVARVSSRTDGPMMGIPETWEQQQVLLRFSAQVEQGENPPELTFYEVVQEPDGHYLRFMKAIDTKSMRLACHGAA